MSFNLLKNLNFQPQEQREYEEMHAELKVCHSEII